MSYRGQHFLDLELDHTGRTRRRLIQNWLSYRTSDGVWRSSNVRIRATEPGEDFQGVPLQFVLDRQPLQGFLGAPAALGGRPWWGLRRSEREDVGVLWFLENGNAGRRTVDLPTRTVTYPACLPGADLDITFFAGRVEKWITLQSAAAGEGGTGDRATLGALLPDGWSLEIVSPGTPGNHLLIKRPNGTVAYLSRPARAIDATDANVPCSFLLPAQPTGTIGGRTFWRVRVRILPGSATYPIKMDPTITVSGTASIEDTTIASTLPNNNLGASGSLSVMKNGATIYSVLMRVDVSGIPSPSQCTGFRLLWRSLGGTSPDHGAYLVNPNADWVEGTATNGIQAGSCCWNFLAYDTAAWPGGVGAEADVVPDATPPTLSGTFLVDALHVFSLKPAWVDEWVSDPGNNNGILITSINPAKTGVSSWHSTEGVLNKDPQFEIDYEIVLSDGLSDQAIDPSMQPTKRPWLDPRLVAV